MLEQMMLLMLTDERLKLPIMWILTACTFLLRVPSECLCTKRGSGHVVWGPEQGTQTEIHVFTDRPVPIPRTVTHRSCLDSFAQARVMLEETKEYATWMLHGALVLV